MFKQIAAPLAAAALLAGCATGYQDGVSPVLGFHQGYREEKAPGELIKVTFRGNVLTARETVGKYLLYRCAEIAQRENKAYFAFYPTLVSAVTDKRGNGNPAGTFTTQSSSYAYILLFNAPATGLMSTKEVLARLGPEVKKEATP